MSIANEDAAVIQTLCYTYDHLYPFYSLILGEPFFDSGIIYYFDGRLLAVNTYLMSQSSEPISEAFTAVHRAIEKLDPDAINLWGPLADAPCLPPLEGWTRSLMATPSPNHRDVVLDLGTYNPAVVPHLRRSLEYQRQRRIDVRRSEMALSAAHLCLISSFVHTRKLDLFDALFCAYVPIWRIVSPTTTLFEAWQGRSLLGFAILDESFARLPIYLVGFRSASEPAVMDLLTDAMINYCISIGCSKLALGHSYHESLLEYKLKWGSCEIQEGFSEVLLSKPGIDISPACYPLMARVVKRPEIYP